MGIKVKIPQKGTTAIRIHPTDELHRIIEKLQSFIHLSEGNELTKEDVVLRLTEEKSRDYEKIIKSYAGQ